jgi:hypothetical protein
MNPSQSAPPTAPTRRELRSPYFIFRTLDGTGTYFTAENLPIVMSPKEPLSRFLAPARVVESGGVRSITYDLAAIPLDTARPMEFLPQSEIDAFAEAVRAFYDKAHEAAQRIVPYEKRLRAHFRLPDPELEADAYWVYGPAHDRRLLILWGCEFKAGTSLPLAPDDELKIPAGRTILDRLQAHVMSWETRQREAFKMALNSAEPLARFLARPALDPSGRFVGVALQGQTIPARKLKPLRRVWPGECAAFDKAASRFYDKARAEAPDVTAYEKEIRRAFRLPDPDQLPGSYFVRGKSLVILVDGRETQKNTLPLTRHPAIVPEAPSASPAFGDGAVIVASPGGDTIAAKLSARKLSPWLKPALAAAAVLVLAIGGLFVARAVIDRTPPKLINFDKNQNVGLPGDTQVIVRFSKAIDPASIKTDAKEASFRFGDNKATVQGQPEVDPKNPATVKITTSKLVDGERYELVVRGLADKAGNKLPATAPITFDFFDTAPPVLTKVSGGPNKNQVTLIFSKTLKPETVTPVSHYSVTTSDGAEIRIRQASLDPTDKEGTRIILEAEKDFSDGLPYRIASISGVKDTKKQGNFVELPPKGFDFEYADIMPPQILSVAGSAGRLEITLTFSKPVNKDAGIAENVSNYTVTAPDKSPLSLVPGSARFNEQGNVLKLRFADPGLLAPGRYQIAAKNIRDAKGNVIDETPVQFEFSDMDDRTPLAMTAGKVVGNLLRVEFSRVLQRADANDRTKFELYDDRQRPLRDLAIEQAQRVPESPTQVLLTFSKDPPHGSLIVVWAVGVTDIFGQKAEQPVRLARPVAVVGVPMATSAQVLEWIGRPMHKNNTVTLTIKEEVARTTAMNLANYDFAPDTVQVDRVSNVRVETNPKSGTRRTIITLVLRSPLLSPAGVKLAVHDFEAEGLSFLGPQNLDAIELAAAP